MDYICLSLEQKQEKRQQKIKIFFPPFFILNGQDNIIKNGWEEKGNGWDGEKSPSSVLLS